jgi:hypothetical protein
MEEKADKNSPELELVSDSGIVLVLELENWAIPCPIILQRPCETIGQQYGKANEKDNWKHERYTFDCETWYENGIEWRFFMDEKLIRLWQFIHAFSRNRFLLMNNLQMIGGPSCGKALAGCLYNRFIKFFIDLVGFLLHILLLDISWHYLLGSFKFIRSLWWLFEPSSSFALMLHFLLYYS